MFRAARLGGLIGPLPSTFFFVLGGASLAAAVGIGVDAPFRGDYPVLALLEVAGFGAAGLVLETVGVRRWVRERREAAAFPRGGDRFRRG
jgi:hypothetical protein